MLMSGILYLVATPIGNLGDMTYRAVEVLKSVDFILAEDTRISQRVLSHYEIDTPFYSSVYQGAERQRALSIVALLKGGKNMALVSDAGTPLISDPGFPLVRAAVEQGCRVVPVPGPCAAIAGLIASGLPVDHFTFGGALPRGRGERRSLFLSLEYERKTHVFYESSHRIHDSLQLLLEVLPSRKLALARELTKIHEEFLRGTAGEVREELLAEDTRSRGEFVLLIGGADTCEPVPSAEAHKLLTELRADNLPAKSLVRILVSVLGIPRNEAYRYVHQEDEG